MKAIFKGLADAAANPYAATGAYPWHFARGKLRHDPVFLHLLRQQLIPDRGCLLDLGCGYGVLMALLRAARERHTRGDWPVHWPPPPRHIEMRGIELRQDRARVAQHALQGDARVTQGDIRHSALPRCTAIVILDVLLYLDDGEQRALLARAAEALPPGGVLLLREADAAAGLRFGITRWSTRVADIRHGGLRCKLHFRSALQWTELLRGLGFAVRVQPMSDGTPFANVLFVATRQEGMACA